MNQEERITKLEQELADLSNRFKIAGGILESFLGAQVMYQVAVDAIIVSHPYPPALRPVLTQLMARCEAHTVGEIRSEEHLSGLQSAQEGILRALDEAERLHRLGDVPENQPAG